MNLELIDPFNRQVPDRVDATLQLTAETKSPAYHLSYARRGTYLAVGYSSGTVAVFDTTSRQAVAVYPRAGTQDGVTSVSWSRRSRTLLAGAAGEAEVRLYDTTNPLGPDEYNLRVLKPVDEDPVLASRKGEGLFRQPYRGLELVNEVRAVEPVEIELGQSAPRSLTAERTAQRHPGMSLQLSSPMAGSLQVNPHYERCGLAVLHDGRLSVFSFPRFDSQVEKAVVVSVLPNSSVTCAAFDSQGKKIYATTPDGQLMVLDAGTLMQRLADGGQTLPQPATLQKVSLQTQAWHVLVQGSSLVVNCSDGSLKMFDAELQPMKTFSDVVSKVKFTSCALSGDGEYLVGATNAKTYVLHIWNTQTGTLLDTLTGPSNVSLAAVAWHPTRSFVAVATSDGLVDVWGPRINWTAFAPDFQALPRNIEYMEREDELDVDANGKFLAQGTEGAGNEDEHVDVLTIEPVPVFASDSEDEDEVFHFPTRVKGILNLRTAKKDVDD